MRLTMDRRWLAALLAAALVVGCDGGKSKPGSSEGSASGKGGSAPVTPSGPTARQQADAFLKDLGDGKVAPDRLTSAFKKKLAPPGKDGDAVAKEWLEQFKGATFKVSEEDKVGEAVALRGLAIFPNKKESERSTAFSLRLVNGHADWLHTSGRQGAEIKVPADASMAAAHDTVRNFLDVMLGGDVRQAHGLMAAAWRKTLSPVADKSDTQQGYDYGPGFIDGKLRSWRSDYTSYTLTPTDHGSSKDTIVFVALMDAGNKKDKHTVKATKDAATGEWLVSDFEKQ
ncbi:MAG TPA: hypothetical protein VHR66_09060 [Gemmataceae bacterium]|jgi:hypothetical protein|nr:hypothetical protein [Gemmataceae bacterium]